MEDGIYKITLADGTKIDNLRLNGNNYASNLKVTSDIFDGKLSTVTINDGERDTIYNNMELVQITEYDDGYYFILRQLSEQEIREMKIIADIDYIAMMSDIDLEEV